MTDSINNLRSKILKLKELESSNDGKCSGCNREVYRDACVIIRPGFWAEPAAFHDTYCNVASAMRDIANKVIQEEEEQQKQWHQQWCRENLPLLKKNFKDK